MTSFVCHCTAVCVLPLPAEFVARLSAPSIKYDHSVSFTTDCTACLSFLSFVNNYPTNLLLYLYQPAAVAFIAKQITQTYVECLRNRRTFIATTPNSRHYERRSSTYRTPPFDRGNHKHSCQEDTVGNGKRDLKFKWHHNAFMAG